MMRVERIMSNMAKAAMRFLLVGLLVGVIGCEKQPVEPTDEDLRLAGEVGIPENLLSQALSVGGDLRQLEGFAEDGSPTKAMGVTVDVPQRKSDAAVRKLQNVAPPGYLAFISERHYGIGGDPDQVSVVKATSIGEVLAIMGTNGWNYDMSPEDVIARVNEWDERFGLVLRGAAFDWFESEFLQQPTDMLQFADEVYVFCPDVVDQGTETVEVLAEEMTRTNTLFCWWD